MDSEQPPPSGDAPCVVHLTEHRGSWNISVTSRGHAARFHSQHRDALVALATAKALAAAECGDLLVLLAGQSARLDFVPAAAVASYVLPIRPPSG
jgi:hypothetical protein